MDTFPTELCGIAWGVEHVQAELNASQPSKWVSPGTLPDQFEADWGATWPKLLTRALAPEGGPEDELKLTLAITKIENERDFNADALEMIRQALKLGDVGRLEIVRAVRKLVNP